MDHNLYCIPDDGKAFARAARHGGMELCRVAGPGLRRAQAALLASVSGLSLSTLTIISALGVLKGPCMTFARFREAPVERRVGRIRGLGFDTIET